VEFVEASEQDEKKKEERSSLFLSQTRKKKCEEVSRGEDKAAEDDLPYARPWSLEADTKERWKSARSNFLQKTRNDYSLDWD